MRCLFPKCPADCEPSRRSSAVWVPGQEAEHPSPRKGCFQNNGLSGQRQKGSAKEQEQVGSVAKLVGMCQKVQTLRAMGSATSGKKRSRQSPAALR